VTKQNRNFSHFNRVTNTKGQGMKRSKSKRAFITPSKIRKSVECFFLFLLGLLFVGVLMGCHSKKIIRKGDVQTAPNFMAVENYLRNHPLIDKVEHKKEFERGERRVRSVKSSLDIEYESLEKDILGRLTLEMNEKDKKFYYIHTAKGTRRVQFGNKWIEETLSLMKEIESYLVETLNMDFIGKIEVHIYNGKKPNENFRERDKDE
jgi:hypothetical protein